MDEVRLSSDLAAEDGEEPDLLALGGTGLGQGADEHQSPQGLVTRSLREEGVPDLLQEEDKHVEDVGSDAGRAVRLTQGDQDIQHIVMEEKLKAGSHALGRPGHRLLLHQQLEHLVEVECQVSRLYGLALELGMRSGGVIVEKLVPVMSEVPHWRNIRGHDRAQETQHFVRECYL